MKKYQSFSSENVQDLEVKFSIYLHRRVFVMYYLLINIQGPDFHCEINGNFRYM